MATMAVLPNERMWIGIPNTVSSVDCSKCSTTSLWISPYLHSLQQNTVHWVSLQNSTTMPASCVLKCCRSFRNCPIFSEKTSFRAKNIPTLVHNAHSHVIQSTSRLWLQSKQVILQKEKNCLEPLPKLSHNSSNFLTIPIFQKITPAVVCTDFL